MVRYFNSDQYCSSNSSSGALHAKVRTGIVYVCTTLPVLHSSVRLYHMQWITSIAISVAAASMYSVHCTMYNVHCTVYNVQCTMYSVQCTVYNVQCTMYSVQCTVYNVQCTMYSVQCTVYNVQCTMYSVHRQLYKCTLYTEYLYNCLCLRAL